MKNTKLTHVEWEQIIINRAFGMGTVANDLFRLFAYSEWLMWCKIGGVKVNGA